MASLDHGRRLIKLMTPEQVSKALAEWLLVQGGYEMNRRCLVTTQFSFDRKSNSFKSCRVELEVP